MSMYWHGTGRVSKCLNRRLHLVLGFASAIILMICFCNEPWKDFYGRNPSVGAQIVKLVCVRMDAVRFTTQIMICNFFSWCSRT